MHNNELKSCSMNIQRLTVGSTTFCVDEGGCSMMLDLSSTFIYGPSNKIKQMAKFYGGTFNNDYGVYTVLGY